MSPQGVTNDSSNNNNKNRKTKPIAVLAMAGVLVGAAILLSGLSLISNHDYHSVLAQQQNTIEGTGGSAAAQGGNATTTGGGAANQSTSELGTNLEQARTALQNNDTQTAMMYLDMAIASIGGDSTEGSLGSNGTAAGVGGNATTIDNEEVVSIGGTGPADDYDATADD